MAQGAVQGAGESAGGKQPLQQGQEEETAFSISEVKRTEVDSGSGDAPAGLIEAGAAGSEDRVRTASEGVDGEARDPSPLKTDAEISRTSTRSPFHDEVGEGELVNDFADGDGEHNWDTIPNEPASPALRGVHRIAVEVMRRSFGSADADPALLAFRRERTRADRSGNEDEDDDDDGMSKEEQSLSTKAADLHQSLTDVSVDDIDVQEALRGHAQGATGGHGEGTRRKLPPAAAAAAAVAAAAAAAVEAEAGADGVDGRGRLRSRSRSRGGAGEGGRESDGDEVGMMRAMSLSGAEDGRDGGGYDGGLVTRAMARRPLREMLRLEEERVEGDEEGSEPAAHLEHLPAFTERWAAEALTPHVLSQVFSGLVPVASSQGQAEPVCTYMLECCVRPDVDAATVLHVASQVAANHGLELVRKRGGQVLFGVAPPNTNGSFSQLDSQQDYQNQDQPWSPRASGIVLPPSPAPTPPAAGTPPSPSAAASGASAATSSALSASAATGGAGSGRGKGGDGGGAGGGSAPSSTRVRAGNAGGKGRSAAPAGGATELRGWWGAGGAGWGSWSHVDMQLVVGQASKHRVLLIRFVTARTATCRDVFRLAAAAAENGQPLAIAPAAQGFVSSVRGALRDRGTLLESLQECPPQGSKIDIDPQFLSQVEGMCQFDMVASLREAGVSLDEHARNEELRGVVVTRLLEEMFELVGLPMLPPPPQLVLAMPRPNDILPSSVEPMPDLTQEDEAELASHRFSSEAGRVTANVLARCVRYTEKCDEQMTARMQRKNRQVMQRISRSQLYQRELFQALRDGHVAVRRARMTAAFSRVMQNRPEVGIDPNIEAPVYFCSIVCNRRPGVLYLTYWHICAVTRVPGFSAAVSVMDLQEVDAVEIVKLFVGHGIQIRKSTRTPADSSSSPPSLSPVPPSLASSASPPPPPRRSNGQVDAAAAAAAVVAAKKVRPASITFATTKVTTAELRELIVALVRVHREPVTSPTTAERAAARAAAAARASPGL